MRCQDSTPATVSIDKAESFLTIGGVMRYPTAIPNTPLNL